MIAAPAGYAPCLIEINAFACPAPPAGTARRGRGPARMQAGDERAPVLRSGAAREEKRSECALLTVPSALVTRFLR